MQICRRHRTTQWAHHGCIRTQGPAGYGGGATGIALSTPVAGHDSLASQGAARLSPPSVSGGIAG
jgi:hypothetical protein